MRVTGTRLVLVCDFLGTFVFALEGASAAIAANLDLLGLLVLSFATTLGGGIIRDVLIGATPPGSILDWRYSAIAFTGGAATFFFQHFVQAIPPSVVITLDATGLGLFGVAGAEKALEYKIHPFLAVLMGGITGVGGGTVRDILLAQIPTVLRADVYATAALAGAAILVIAIRFGMPRALAAGLGGVCCFLLRIVSVWQHWNLPKMAGH